MNDSMGLGSFGTRRRRWAAVGPKRLERLARQDERSQQPLLPLSKWPKAHRPNGDVTASRGGICANTSRSLREKEIKPRKGGSTGAFPSPPPSHPISPPTLPIPLSSSLSVPLDGADGARSSIRWCDFLLFVLISCSFPLLMYWMGEPIVHWASISIAVLVYLPVLMVFSEIMWQSGRKWKQHGFLLGISTVGSLDFMSLEKKNVLHRNFSRILAVGTYDILFCWIQCVSFLWSIVFDFGLHRGSAFNSTRLLLRVGSSYRSGVNSDPEVVMDWHMRHASCALHIRFCAIMLIPENFSQISAICLTIWPFFLVSMHDF